MKENKTNALIIALIVILFIGGIGGAYYIGKLRAENSSYKDFLGGGNAPQPTEQPQGQEDLEEVAKNAAEITVDDHIRGNKDAKVALIEYSDYQCPFCTSFHNTAAQAIEEYGDKLMWVYRHYPLDGLHPLARNAAEASECVADVAGNDAFWSFSDALFEDQDSIESADYIKQLALQTEGVDQASYESCVQSDEAATAVQDDLDNGLEAGVQGTPGVIIRNIETGEVKVLPGAVPIGQVKTAIDALLAE